MTRSLKDLFIEAKYRESPTRLDGTS